MPEDSSKNAEDPVWEIDVDSSEESLDEVLESVSEAGAGDGADEADQPAEEQDSAPAPESLDSDEASDAVEEEPEVAVEAELAQTQERLLRALADIDNLRKRADKERSSARELAVVEPLREFVGVVDNLERALGAEGSLDDLKSGVEMIHRQMLDVLRRFEVESVPGEGTAFDPAVHEAVASETISGIEEATVVQELQKGYMVRSRLLRAAMVKVGLPGPKEEGSEEEVAPDEESEES